MTTAEDWLADVMVKMRGEQGCVSLLLLLLYGMVDIYSYDYCTYDLETSLRASPLFVLGSKARTCARPTHATDGFRP